MAYPIEFRLIKAALGVKNEYSYYSPAIVRVRFRHDSINIHTMGVNCNLVISYNESFADKLTNQELKAVVLHEILHYMNGHHVRYMNNPLRDILPHSIHNIAMDIEINEFIPELPKSGFKASDFGFPERKSYEEYLGMINRNMPPKLRQLLESPAQSGYMPIDDLKMDGYNEIYQEILHELIMECEEAEIGNETDSENIIRKVRKRKYPWEQVFQNIVTTKVTEITAGYRYRTFIKPNRRYAHFSNIIFPQWVDYKTKISLAIIMDISGSMGENVNKMYGVMKSMVDILDLQIDITVLEVNVSVENIKHGFDLRAESIKSKDGGGTDMSAGLYHIQDKKMYPDLIIVMTDSDTPWPNPPILADKTVVLTDNPHIYDGPYPVFPVIF
jgi:predicted metal-dependent peptidase